jgi:hypothetical protein
MQERMLKMSPQLKSWIISAALLTFSPGVFAEWVLNNDLSRLSFISIKATDIGEVHKFTQLSGEIAADGSAAVIINLASADTLIPSRDERMREFLFETDIFPSAEITVALDGESLSAQKIGEVQIMAIEANLEIKDKQIPITAEVLVSKVGHDTLVVTALQPIMMTAAAVGLSDGVEKLRELAGLPSIRQAVPVHFVCTFQRRTPL